eukprot:29815-Chlamydomonas_euryale.AAC.3
MEEEEKAEAAAAAKRAALEEASATGRGCADPDTQFGKWYSDPSAAAGESAPKAVRSGVGKYIHAAVLPTTEAVVPAAPSPAAPAAAVDAMPPPPAKKPKVAGGGFGNFDACWLARASGLTSRLPTL